MDVSEGKNGQDEPWKWEVKRLGSGRSWSPSSLNLYKCVQLVYSFSC